MERQKPTPTHLAMLICDMVMDDRKTGKKILIGAFNSISTKTFPVILPEMHVFLSLTNGHGKYQGMLKCIKADNDETLMGLRGSVNFLGPLDVVEIDFALKNLMFRSDGTYIFQFYCDDQLVVSRKFRLLKIGENKNAKRK